jgi:hypothetical protein
MSSAGSPFIDNSLQEQAEKQQIQEMNSRIDKLEEMLEKVIHKMDTMAQDIHQIKQVRSTATSKRS